MNTRAFILALSLSAAALLRAADASREPSSANRLTYLDQSDPFHVGLHFAKLTTPQWVGEPGVEAVVTLGIDDLRETARYETFLRPILDRLKRIDGRAPVSIFCNALNPDDPRLQSWLKEGLSLEVHTLSHPCPLLAKGDFAAAENTFHGGVDLLSQVPGNTPVAFRTPCCDSINSPSPRVYAELFSGTSSAGRFLRMDSSVMMLLTTNDTSLPRDLVLDPDGRGRFTKYVPFPSFVTTVQNYPYPWVIGRLCWEFPCLAPSDWEAHNILGDTSPIMLADWVAALDAVVRKQGAFNFVFHPHGWSSSAQFVAFIDHAIATYGSKVKYLNYREAHERLTTHLTAGQPLRAADGGDNGIRLLDLNNDGYLDVVIGNPELRRTRLWNPATRNWHEGEFPVALVERTPDGVRRDTGVHFGILRSDGRATMLVRNERTAGAWSFEGGRWAEEPALMQGLEDAGEHVLTSVAGHDRGVRFRDVDGDGLCELLVANERQNAVFRWNPTGGRWDRSDLALPEGTLFVNSRGEDNGLRFVDVNEDGHDDVLFSNEERFGLWLYQPEFYLGWGKGWTRKVTAGARASVVGLAAPAVATPAEDIPAIVRAGAHRNNGAWIHSRHLWIQNEDTAHLTNLVDRRAFDDLLRGVLPPPKSPAEALATFRVRPGFRVELVAAEPLVRDPVAFEWDAAGRLWVAEMRDYPLGIDGNGRPGGVIKFLEDTNRDGIYDRATEFLKDVNFPTGVQPWRQGVLISAAPDVLYAEDTNGDGTADIRRVLFTGFREGNQQHRVNGFALGLDGWVYGANGDSGGEIRGSPTSPTTSIKGSDFRFRPDTGEFEAIEGQTQFGRVRNDWGDWFGNANYTLLWHYPWPARYVARNPHLAVRDLRRQLTSGTGHNRIFPASRAMPRPNAVGEENTVTSACSPAPYRDELFGPDFATSVFIAEPSENLVHREVVVESGAGFTSSRAPDEESSEFLASTDNWFRPVQLKTGPDGALYLADMYRLIIEHPEWIPPDLKSRLDLRAGEDRGRIYRILPTHAALRPVPRLDTLGTPGLVAAMESPNGWQRDTAMRLLRERDDRTAVAPLQRLATSATNGRCRFQALATLGLLNALDAPTLVSALRDPQPAVRSQALRLAEPALGGSAPNAALKEAVLRLADDPAPRVALQLAFTLGELADARAGQELVRLVLRQPDDAILLTAVLSSSVRHVGTMMQALAAAPQPPAQFLERLLSLAASLDDQAALEVGVTAVLRLDPTRNAANQFTALAGLFQAWERRGRQVDPDPSRFAPVIDQANRMALDDGADEPLRLAALRLLEHASEAAGLSAGRLIPLLAATQSPAIQRAALQVLRRRDAPAVADSILHAWDSLTPESRAGAVEVLLTRRPWIDRLLDALESGQPPPRELGVAARQRLLTHAAPDVRERAGRLVAAMTSDRQAVVEQFAAVATLRGDAQRGRELFRAHCVSCHRLQAEGYEVGPDLGAIIDKTSEALLIAILDPNRAVEERYVSYTAVTRGGREFTGVIAGESPNSLTLRNAAGAEDVLLRTELASITSTRRSLMPEGFETLLDAPALADLIAFVTSTAPRPKNFPGNQPAMVLPDATGALHLTARNAEIYGDSLVFEGGFANLGYWQSPNDHAVWKVQLAGGAKYDVWLDGAWPGTGTTNRLRVGPPAGALEALIPATGSWDIYRQCQLGRITLEAGQQRIVARGLAPLHGAILDLRELRLTPAGSAPPPDFHDLIEPTR